MLDSAEAKRLWGLRLAATTAGWAIAIFNGILTGEFSVPPPTADRPVFTKRIAIQLAVGLAVVMLWWWYFRK